MHKVKITFKELEKELAGESAEFPPYASPILNLANRFAQATRPKVVGQLTELMRRCPYRTYGEWKEWYESEKPGVIEEAIQKIMEMLNNFEQAMQEIDQETVRKWVEDLVLTKTFVGLRFQEAMLKRIASELHKEYRPATPEEESKGIDGFISDVPVSVKPQTYKVEEARLAEEIEARIVYYRKVKGGIVFEYALEEF